MQDMFQFIEYFFTTFCLRVLSGKTINVYVCVSVCSSPAGPEPEYNNLVSGYKLFHHQQPFELKYGQGVLPELRLAYETWGTMNANKDNVILLSPGLSASSHAKSHKVGNTTTQTLESSVSYLCGIITYVQLTKCLLPMWYHFLCNKNR